jgi:hypothetical protein
MVKPPYNGPLTDDENDIASDAKGMIDAALAEKPHGGFTYGKNDPGLSMISPRIWNELERHYAKEGWIVKNQLSQFTLDEPVR